jgi:SAM-dependent methyltransferase
MAAMPNPLRPGRAEAEAQWGALVRANREQVERVRETPEETDFYGPVAESFKADPRREGDDALDALLALVRPGETWLDIGAGAGRFGLPIALRAGKVIAVDGSPGMLAALREVADAHGIANVEAVESRWPTTKRFETDGALMANIGMDIEEIGPFLDAMEASARRLCVAMMPLRQPTRPHDRLWPAVHGMERATLPALAEFLVLLLSRGRRFELTLTERPASGHHSKDEIVAGARRQTWVAPGSAKDRLLTAAIEREARPVDGGWTLEDEPRTVGIVRWAPPGR